MAHGGKLPAEATRFFGRAQEAAAIKEALARSRLVTLTGPGGVGKTRLAVRVAGEVARTFPDGVFVADLSAERDAAGIERAVASALGDLIQPGSTGRTSPGWLATTLHGKRALLILDTCEHLVDACAAFADAIIRGAAEPVLLVTGRQPLDLPGEVVFKIGPLGVADGDGGGDAVRLLADRAAAAAPGFAVTAATLPRVVDLCRLLDGVPLAIELAALRLRTIGLDELAGWLPGHLRQLSGGRSPAAAGRHQSLLASVAWSYDLCTQAERLLWTRLSVFADGFDLAAAEAVCGSGTPREVRGVVVPPGDDSGSGSATDVPQEDIPFTGMLGVDEVLDTLVALVDKSIVLRERDAGDAARYRLLGVVREHGAEFATDTQVCAARHRGHYLDVARAFAAAFAAAGEPGQPGLVAVLDRDEGNLRLAFGGAMAAGDAALAAELALACLPWLVCTDRFGLASSWLSAVAARPAGAGHGSRHRQLAIRVAGWLAVVQGDATGAAAQWDGLIVSRAGAGPRAGAGSAASGAAATGDETGAEDRTADPPDPGGQLVQVLDGIGAALAALRHGAFADCATRCDELAAALPPGERWARGWAAWLGGVAGWLAGDKHAAGERLRTGLELLVPFGGELPVALHLEAFAWLAAAAGDYRRTARLHGAADRIWQRLAAREEVRVPRFGLALLDAEREGAASQAIDGLGAARYTAEHSAGVTLSTEAAVRNAAPGPVPHPRAAPRQAPAAWQASARRSADNHPGQAAAAASAARWDLLTAREREVAALVASGLANKDIAARLIVSKRTVDAHIEHILGKLGYSSRVQIAALAAGHREPANKGRPAP